MLQPQAVMWYIHSVLRRQPRRALRGIRALMRLRLYLDTSVISAYVDDRMPERRWATVEFWRRLSEFDVSVSELTVTEVRATGDVGSRRQMEEMIASFEVLPVGEEDRALAREYVRRGVFSPATLDDALHVAMAVVSTRDLPVS